MEQVHTLLGVLSDEALKGLMQCRKATLGAGWGVALWPLGADNWEVPLTSDLAVARVGKGVMVDIGLQSEHGLQHPHAPWLCPCLHCCHTACAGCALPCWCCHSGANTPHNLPPSGKYPLDIAGAVLCWEG